MRESTIEMPLQLAVHTLSGITGALARDGYAIVPNFLDNTTCAALAAEGQRQIDAGLLKMAGVGQGEEHSLRREIRSDHILWLDDGNSAPLQRQYLALLEAYRQEVNRQLFIGLFEFEGHLALYPPGSFYKRHLDRFRDDDRRTVTAILYLNDDWKEENGGQLRFYPNGEKSSEYIDVLPEAGTFVTFLSHNYWHEVMPGNRERMSLTGWFKRR
ncbi:MAG: 2OG-Fe(II) oxygenase [Chromatiales bacterium]|nr:2OG-Fe(II) oxygenase [Chromatiales bacterium]